MSGHETFIEIDSIPSAHGILPLLPKARLPEQRLQIYRLEAQASAESLLEKSRTAGHRGDWEACVRLATQALQSSPAAFLKLAILQCRSVALFELGDFARCESDLDSLASMLPLFPQAHAGFYAEVLRARVRARLVDARSARLHLEQLWDREKKANLMSAELVMALLRAEIDLNRIEGKPIHPLSLFCFWIADAMNHPSYQALAAVDLCYSENPPEAAERILAALEAKSERVRRLRAEIAGIAKLEGSAVPSTTARSIHESLARADRNGSNQPARSTSKPDIVLLVERSVSLRLEPLEIRSLALAPLLNRALKLLAAQAPQSSQRLISAEAFFARLWSGQKYVPSLHDEVIRDLLGRLRKAAGIDLCVRDGWITLPEKQWLLGAESISRN